MRATLNATMQPGPYREETLNGRDYIVVNMTLIVPGVLDGSNGPLLYEENELAKDPDLWNGIPLIAYHPEITNADGETVATSARDPNVLAKSQIGYNYRTEYKDGALRSEGWFDKDLTANYDANLPEEHRMLPRLLNGQPIELSTGLFAENLPAKGTHNGTPYHYVARNYKADHIAILPDQQGACSVKDGCGTNIASNSVEEVKVSNCRRNCYGLCVNCGGKGGKPGPCPDPNAKSKKDSGGSDKSSAQKSSSSATTADHIVDTYSRAASLSPDDVKAVPQKLAGMSKDALHDAAKKMGMSLSPGTSKKAAAEAVHKQIKARQGMADRVKAGGINDETAARIHKQMSGKGSAPAKSTSSKTSATKASSTKASTPTSKPAQSTSPSPSGKQKAFRNPAEANKLSGAADSASKAANIREPYKQPHKEGSVGHVPHEEAIASYKKKQEAAAEAHDKAEKEHRKLASTKGPTSSRHASIAEHHKTMADHYRKRATSTRNKRAMSNRFCFNCGGAHGKHGPCPKGDQGSVKGSDSDSGAGTDDAGSGHSDDIHTKIHEHLKKNPGATPSELRKLFAPKEKYKPHDPLSHSVHKALVKLRDAGKIKVSERQFGEPGFHANRSNPNKDNNMKEQLTRWLIANCDCWKNKEKLLDSLDETELKELRNQAIAKRITNAAAAKFSGAFTTNAEGEGEVAGFDYATLAEFFSIEVDITKDPVGFIKALRGKLQEVMDALDHSEPAPAPEPAPAVNTDNEPALNAMDDVGPAKDPTQTSNKRRKLTPKEFAELMPDEFKDAWTDFVGNSRNERVKLLNHITNGVTAQEKKTLLEAYKNMPLPQLRVVAKRMGMGTAQNNNRRGYLPEDNLPTFGGGSGYSPDTDTEPSDTDILESPVQNFSRKERFAQKQPNHLTVDDNNDMGDADE